jgi:acyl-coenzyme A thioesterase PaaI-like protein
VQGGVLMTFADRTCGMTARYASGKQMLATVQLDTHFVEAGKIGEILVSRPRLVRSTRSLIFITTEITVDQRCIAMASGVFKILRSEQPIVPANARTTLPASREER